MDKFWYILAIIGAFILVAPSIYLGHIAILKKNVPNIVRIIALAEAIGLYAMVYGLLRLIERYL